MNKTRAFNPAILIPVYNHEEAIKHTLVTVLNYEYPVLLVDDGSDRACRNALVLLANNHPDQVSLIRLKTNGGKGAAVKAGFRKLYSMGYSHALQVDADGQHDLSDLPRFIKEGEVHTDALISGCPEYDASVPKGRYYSRYLTHIWVWINTLSFEIKDSMCGFRLYPLVETIVLIDKDDCGDRMDFDVEIIVRWLWRGGRVKSLTTKVHYPADGVSHFKAVRDNVLISWMHTRLFFGMLVRLPLILGRKFK
ncbi:MAG: glycosyltransferase family 2 protein [Cycloclasticus sp.]|nr:glycosyltransferase family 2 protein [Cycloclasticus sp.]